MNDYHNEKKFLKALAVAFNISNVGSQAGVITFSEYAQHSIKLNGYTNVSSFNRAVDAIPFMGSSTRIDIALRLAQREMFTTGNGGRPGIPKVLILLTDGHHSGSEDPAVIADEIRKTGVHIIVIGIGANTHKIELNRIAGGPGNAFNVSSFDELIADDFIKTLTQKSCDVAGECNLNFCHVV